MKHYKKMTMQKQLREETGFTIIELMIATLVFASILLVITFGVVHFTNDYYKGVNSSTTQTTTQAALDTISQAIQFSAIDAVGTDGTEGFFCAGTKLYVYDLGKVFNGNPAVGKGLYEMNRIGSACTARPAAAGRELLDEKMRLSSISLTKLSASASTNGGDIWQLAMTVAYGDGDLLCNTSKTGTTTGSCQAGAGNYTLSDLITGDDVACKIQTGAQFCSVATLSTVAQQRIVN